MTTLLNTVKINLIGTGCLIVKGIIDNELWQKLNHTSTQLNSSFETAVFDAEFFTLLNDNNYKSFHDLGNIKVHGLLHNNKSHIEIRVNGKNRKIKLIDIINDNIQNSLLPLFNKKEIELAANFESEREFIMIETEIGLIASYKIQVEKFDMDKLQYVIYKLIINDIAYTVIGNLTYNSKTLKSIGADALVSGNSIFMKSKS